MTNTWIVVADSTRARIMSPSDDEPKELDEIIHYVGRAGYTGAEKTSAPKFQEIADLVHPISQMKPQELETDRGGRVKGPGGNAPYDSRHVDYDHQRAEEMTREITDYLMQAHQKNEFEQLVLVAPPKMLGVLRNQLPNTLQKLVVSEIDREYTLLSAQKIEQLLSKKMN
ncbi:MAG: host attachment protein [Planctomycetaceae bacterium]|nr:host attachment protein [Planctomycetaceae bacterium]